MKKLRDLLVGTDSCKVTSLLSPSEVTERLEMLLHPPTKHGWEVFLGMKRIWDFSGVAHSGTFVICECVPVLLPNFKQTKVTCAKGTIHQSGVGSEVIALILATPLQIAVRTIWVFLLITFCMAQVKQAGSIGAPQWALLLVDRPSCLEVVTAMILTIAVDLLAGRHRKTKVEGFLSASLI